MRGMCPHGPVDPAGEFWVEFCLWIHGVWGFLRWRR